jgi:hypothetical protein
MKGQCGIFTKPQTTAMKQFLQEAYFQHIQAYFNLLDIEWPLTNNLSDTLTLSDQDLDTMDAKLS